MQELNKTDREVENKIQFLMYHADLINIICDLGRMICVRNFGRNLLILIAIFGSRCFVRLEVLGRAASRKVCETRRTSEFSDKYFIFNLLN